MIPDICSLSALDIADANAALERWGHRMGPCRRPIGRVWAHGLLAHGELAAVVVTADLIGETCAGLGRAQALELARLCASRADLCRVMLRLWRVFVLPDLCRSGGQQWAVSYQDEALHTGNTYRLDGWVRIGRSHSGVDRRSGRAGRDKTIWGWTWDADALRARAMVTGRVAA